MHICDVYYIFEYLGAKESIYGETRASREEK